MTTTHVRPTLYVNPAFIITSTLDAGSQLRRADLERHCGSIVAAAAKTVKKVNLDLGYRRLLCHP